jgi:hypothetical protein
MPPSRVHCTASGLQCANYRFFLQIGGRRPVGGAVQRAGVWGCVSLGAHAREALAEARGPASALSPACVWHDVHFQLAGHISAGGASQLVVANYAGWLRAFGCSDDIADRIVKWHVTSTTSTFSLSSPVTLARTLRGLELRLQKALTLEQVRAA